MLRATWLLVALVLAALSVFLIAAVSAGDPIGGVGQGIIAPLA